MTNTSFQVTQAMINDALRFMRVPHVLSGSDGERSLELQDAVVQTFAELEKIIQPRIVWGRFPVSILYDTRDNEPVKNNSEITGIRVGGEMGFEIKSMNLSKLMAHSQECYLMAVTIGSEVDRQILRAQTRGMFEGMMFDACASVRADALCDEAEHEILESLNKLDGLDKDKDRDRARARTKIESLTPRFSPGYGDAPLEASKEIISALDATRRIGLSMTRSFMMTPVKSITALAGVINAIDCKADGSSKKQGCVACLARENCPYAKT